MPTDPNAVPVVDPGLTTTSAATVVADVPDVDPAAPPAGAPPASPSPGSPTTTTTPTAAPRKYELSAQELSDRLGRASGKGKADLLAALGFKDEAEAKAALERLAEHDKRADEARRAQQTREEQLAEEAEKARVHASELEQRLQEETLRRQFEKQDAIIRDIAGKHIDPDLVDAVVAHYGTNVVARMSDKAASALTKKDVERWFTDYAAKHPKLSRLAGAPPPPRREVPGTNGAPPNGTPPQAKGAAGGETPPAPEPGAEEFDGMKATRADYRKWLAKQGLRSPI